MAGASINLLNGRIVCEMAQTVVVSCSCSWNSAQCQSNLRTPPECCSIEDKWLQRWPSGLKGEKNAPNYFSIKFSVPYCISSY